MSILYKYLAAFSLNCICCLWRFIKQRCILETFKNEYIIPNYSWRDHPVLEKALCQTATKDAYWILSVLRNKSHSALSCAKVYSHQLVIWPWAGIDLKRNNVCTEFVFRVEISVVLLTESEPVPSVVPLEHHLLPFLHQLHQLLFDLTQAVISYSYISALLNNSAPRLAIIL